MATMVENASSSTASLRHVPKRFEGTYKNADAVEWQFLVDNKFGNPDWAALYPINAKGQPVGLLSPRMACKVFHDALFILQKADANEKYMQDRVPECTHKVFKKKQWRKQFFQAARRVTCRLAKGLGFSPNCAAEDCFIHVILRDTFELGWRRIADLVEPLPETDKDRDFNRINRLGANDEIGQLYKVDSDQSKEKKIDFKTWFRAYHTDCAHMRDHEMH